MTMPAPKDENDPWLIAIKEALEQRGYCAFLYTKASSPEVGFSTGQEIIEDGIAILTGKSGNVYYSDNQWWIRFYDGDPKMACNSLDEIIEAVLEYLTVPSRMERFGLKDDVPQLLRIKASIEEKGYWALIQSYVGTPHVYFAQLPLSSDTYRYEHDGSVYFSYQNRKWHIHLPIPQQDIALDNVEDILTHVFQFLDSKDEMRELYGLREDDQRLIDIKAALEQHGYWATINKDSVPLTPWTLPGTAVIYTQSPPVDLEQAMQQPDGRIYYNYYHDHWHVTRLVGEENNRWYNEFWYREVDEAIESIFKY